MRTGWRQRRAFAALAGLLALATIAPVRADDDAPVRMALEIEWDGPELPRLPAGVEDSAVPPTIDLSVAGGRVLDAVATPRDAPSPFPPPSSDPPRPHPHAAGAWRLGSTTRGRARVLVEAPLSAALFVDTGGLRTRFDLAALLDGPQTTLPQAAVRVRVERLPWDALTVRLGEGDGLYPPAARVPLTLGFNLLTPEPARVIVRYAAELRPLRGGPPLWRVDPAPEVLPTNQAAPPGRVVTLALPAEEGTYLLEVRATWEPADAAAESSRLLRWLRRNRKAPTPTTVVRRSTLVVLAASPTASAPDEPAPRDLAEFKGGRPRAAGRSPRDGDAWPIPEAALVAPGLRDRLRGWIARGDAAELAPAGPDGLAWTAVPLAPPRPGRPHRLRVELAGGQPDDLGVALVVPGRDGAPARLLLDARGAAPTADADAPALEWPVWPDTTEVVAVLVNRGRGPIRLRSIALEATPADPTPARLVETHGEAGRLLALDASAPDALDRFGGIVEGGPSPDVLALARNLAGYLAHVGAAAAVLPEAMADRADRARLDGQALEDATAPDALALTLRVLARARLSALVRVHPDGALPGLPPPGSAEAAERGLVRLDAHGRPDGAYQALHPEVADALRARLVALATPRLSHPNLLGLVLPLGPGPTLAGAPDSGLDDATFAAFARASFSAAGGPRVPGLGDEPDRFAARATFVAGPARRAWDDWRAQRLGAHYAALARAVAEAAPGAMLALVAPTLDNGPAGREARRADRAGLPPDDAWRALGFDPDHWSDPDAPLLLRPAANDGHGDDLAHDLAFSPELDAVVAARPARGAALLDPVTSPAAPALRVDPGPAHETLVHAVASLDPRWILVGARAAAGREAELARFANVFRALPIPPNSPAPTPRLPSGVAIRSWSLAGRTYVVLANDTPYEVLQAARVGAPARTPIDDLGRGVRLEPAEAQDGGLSLVLRLPPHGLTVVRVADASATVEPRETFLPDLKRLDAEAEDLAARLGRAGQGDGLVGPPLPGFEPPPAADASRPMPGWTAAGDGAIVALDPLRPHAGRAALRLDAPGPSAAAASTPFLPPDGSALTARLWLRADRPDRPVRVWFEGESNGRPVVRRADLTAGTDWTESQLRLLELPPDGLDSLRVRLEWLAAEPGSLWIDDLALAGEESVEPGRRAHRALIEALQAYRARRYADFARLMKSRRTRRVAAAAERIAEQPVDPARSTDLSPGRRLR
jgi:hypothetical protein